MAQNTVLAASVNPGTSSDIVVAAGASVTVGIFPASGQLDPYAVAIVWQDTPGGDNLVNKLDNVTPTAVISGPGTFRVKTAGCSSAFGAFTET